MNRRVSMFDVVYCFWFINEVAFAEVPGLVVLPLDGRDAFHPFHPLHSIVATFGEAGIGRPDVKRVPTDGRYGVKSTKERRLPDPFVIQRSRKGRSGTEWTEGAPVDSGPPSSLPYVTASLGADVFLPCQTSDNMATSVTWFFGRKQITLGGKHLLTAEGLQVRGASMEDSGQYECRDEANKTQKILLLVRHPPFIEELDLPEKVIRGQNVSIRCKVIASSQVTYQWAKEQKVSEMVRVKKKLQGKHEEVLRLREVTSGDDGSYFCSVSDRYGTDEKSVNLRVLYPPEIKSLKERVTVLANSTLVVVCHVTGFPQPSIDWSLTTFQGSTFHSDDLMRHGLTTEVGEGQGRIVSNRARKFMAGNLTCLATNEAGRTAKTALLLVEHEPTAVVSPALQYGWEGQTRRLKCSAVAFPAATLSWFHGDLFIGPGDQHEITIAPFLSDNFVESVLTLSISDKAPWLYGNYTCIAKNIHGHSTGSAQLLQAFVPEAPRNISVVEEWPHRVIITGESRTAPLEPITWSVSYEEHGADSKQEREIFPYGRQVELKNLKPSTEYVVYLALRNAVGQGQPTKFKFQTPAKDSSFPGSNKHHQHHHQHHQHPIHPHQHPIHPYHSVNSNDKVHFSDASFYSISSENGKSGQEFETKFSSMKKSKKKSNGENSKHVVWAVVTGLVLTVASSVGTACLCTAWRRRSRKFQSSSDVRATVGRINSPIPANSILLVPVSNDDENEVETLASELASLSQDSPVKMMRISEPSFGTFPRHFKHSGEKLHCFSPLFSPTKAGKSGEIVDIFGTQFRKIQPESTGLVRSLATVKKARSNFVPIALNRSNDERHSKKFVPGKNPTGDGFSNCGGYKSADNVDDDIESVACDAPCRQHADLTFPLKHPGNEFSCVRSMSHLK